MELPTPPSTRHREEKENRQHYATRVAWKDEHEIYTLTAEVSRRQLTQANTPVKSILKKIAYEVFPRAEEPKREVTPEPSDPLADLHYLDTPVARIIAVDAALRDLIESYSILAARLRACVSGSTDADASWPLFQPLRQHRDAFVQAMCRDLGRALETPPEDDDLDAEMRFLPSPERSPKKKGMSAEAVKYARDLCTTSHSVLRLLSAVFTLPALLGIFEDSHLRDLLTAVLAIPLAPELPTPNARKTCALAIWLLQYQRLPTEVLHPARDRIAYALRRGIEGELGKEGKKGSASDGLKAIHDLSICYPSVFVPAFTDLLPSVFAQLLAPTLVLRTQACHAVGGFAYGLSTLPSSAVHSRVANYTASLLTKAPLGTPSKKPSSPRKDPEIIRTLRTTLAATDPKHVAQGPVWGASLVGYFIIMLGLQVFLDERMSKCIVALSSLANRHSKSSVRSLGCLIWRCMTWAYFQPLPTKLPVDRENSADGSQEAVQDSENESDQEYTIQELQRCRQRMVVGWKILSSVVEMGAGVSTVAALLGPPLTGTDADKALRRALTLLDDMGKRGGFACREALLTVAQLVSRYRLDTSKDADSDSLDGEEDSEWYLAKLLPLRLFSSNPGLLTTEYASLAPVVKGLVAECPHVEEVRTLGQEEITAPWVFDCLIQVWMDGLNTLKIQWGEEFPAEILNIWSCLLNAKVMASRDDEAELSEFAHYVTHILAEILKDKKLDFSSKEEEEEDRLLVLTSPVKKTRLEAPRALPVYRWKPALKLLFVRQLWLVAKSILPTSSLPEPAEALLALVDAFESNLVVDVDVADDVRAQWSSLCAEAAYHCSEQEMLAFWSLKQTRFDTRRKPRGWDGNMRSFVWSHFVEKWREERSNWETSAVLLGIPFLEPNSWDMTDEDLDQWQAFLRCTVDHALDYGVDSVAVLDQIAKVITEHSTNMLTSPTHVAETLLSNLDIADARSLPFSLFALINTALLSSYPPKEHSKVPCLWMLRTLTRIIDACPAEIAEQLLETTQDGLCQWIMDEHCALTKDEYGMDVLPMYQTAVMSMMSPPAQMSTLERLSSLFDSAFLGREDKPEGAIQVFLEFWESGYSTLEEPTEGWSDKLAHCLDMVGLRPLAESESQESVVDEADTSEDEEVESQLLILSSDDAALSPVIPSPKSLAEGFALQSVPSPPRKSSITEPPSTPAAAAIARILTPHRPHKSVSPTKPFDLLFPVSPPHSPIRSLVTPKRPTPGSARSRVEVNEKENASPLRNFVSVAERIALRSPGPTLSVLGKRRFDSEDETIAQDAAKKMHKGPNVVFGESLHNPYAARPLEVHMALLPPDPSLSVTNTPPKAVKLSGRNPEPKKVEVAEETLPPWVQKRKRVFLDAVEVPTLRAILRRSASLQIPPTASSSSAPALPQTCSLPVPPHVDSKAQFLARTLRRTRSVSRMLGDTADALDLKILGKERRAAPIRPILKSNLAFGKRKRDPVEDSDDLYSLTSSLSSPIRRLKEMEAMGSDDSITLATPSLVTDSTLLSSDDDPHRFAGQVTPHRVVSPAIRRVRVEEFFSEPGSDDSNLSASPTSERVARMKRFADSSPQKFLLNISSNP